MVTYYQITTELYVEHVVPVITAKQYDTGRGADITLTDCGAVVVPGGSEQLRLYCKKEDGTISYLTGTLTGSAVRVRFTNVLLAVPGMVECELQIGTGANMVSTPVFNMVVLPSNFDNAAVQSSDEFTALDNALATVQQYDSRITALENEDISLDGRLDTLEGYMHVKTKDYTGTTNSVGKIQGAMTDFGITDGTMILGVYFARGTYSTRRQVTINMYGTAGFELVFSDADTPVATASVTCTIYYV